MGVSDSSSPPWLYPSIQLPSPPAAASTRARGQLPACPHPPAGPAAHPSSQRAPTPAISVPPNSARSHSGPSGQVAPVAARTRGGGESFLCLLCLLPHPGSHTAGREDSGEEPNRASETHTRPESPPTHCSGRRPAGPAPWPPLGLHRDPRPLRPRRPGPGAASTHLRRAHDAAAILAASSSWSVPAAVAAAAAVLSSAWRGRAGPRWGRHCSAKLGAGTEESGAEPEGGQGAGKHPGARVEGRGFSTRGAGLEE